MKKRNLLSEGATSATPITYLFALLIFGGLVSGCSGTLEPIHPPLPKLTFETHDIRIGTGEHPTLLTGFLLEGPFAEIAVVTRDEKGVGHLRLYARRDGTWITHLDIPLRPEVLFVDIANIGGRDRFLTYESGRVNYLDPEAATEHLLAEITTNYTAPSEDRIPAIDLTRDLNHDGLDDLVVPDIDGFWITTQSGDGTFAPPVKLGPTEPFLDATTLDDTRSYREIGINDLTALWYLSRLHQMDYDGDGRGDIVFWDTDHFQVYRQEASGGFSTTAETFRVDIPFDADGGYAIAFEFSGENMFSLIFGVRKQRQRRLFRTFEDMNGDGVADMVIQSIEGRSLGNQRSRYEVHFGNRIADGTRFARNVGMSIRPNGTAGGLQPWGYATQWFEDMDGDGKTDILFKDVKTGFMGMSRAMLGNSIAIDIEGYRMKAGRFPNSPTTQRKIRPKFDLIDAPGVLFPVVLLGDVNGDTRADLLVGENWTALHIFFGVPGPELFARTPQKVGLVMPKDERNARLVDFNKDNKQDILVYYPAAAEPHRVTLLITQ